MKQKIKTMDLYKSPRKILKDLKKHGFSGDSSIDLDTLNKYDQLHYHGKDAVLECIKRLRIRNTDKVLEVGAGWGGPSRVIAKETGAKVTALELQKDYSEIGAELTQRTSLSSLVNHVTDDYLLVRFEKTDFDAIVSWLALYHIPERETYTKKSFDILKNGGSFFVEGLIIGKNSEPKMQEELKKTLYANSLVTYEAYITSLQRSGFTISYAKNMSQSWLNFTENRYKTLIANKGAYIKNHGPKGYKTIETFYRSAFHYFEKGIIGGIKVFCKKIKR